jgi:hypothetical protein
MRESQRPARSYSAQQTFSIPFSVLFTTLCRRSQVHTKVPDDAWEYQIRKALNDAAYNGLDYVPYCSTMPVQDKCEDPKFMWKKKAGK